MESSDHTFPRAERLRSRKQIARLFEKGESGVVYPIRYVFLTGEDDAGDATDEGGLSVLVSVSKRTHNRANVRNLLKRRIREAYRLNRNPLREISGGGRFNLGLLYVSKEIADYTSIENAVQKIIRNLSERI